MKTDIVSSIFADNVLCLQSLYLSRSRWQRGSLLRRHLSAAVRLFELCTLPRFASFSYCSSTYWQSVRTLGKTAAAAASQTSLTSAAGKERPPFFSFTLQFLVRLLHSL